MYGSDAVKAGSVSCSVPTSSMGECPLCKGNVLVRGEDASLGSLDCVIVTRVLLIYNLLISLLPVIISDPDIIGVVLLVRTALMSTFYPRRRCVFLAMHKLYDSTEPSS